MQLRTALFAASSAAILTLAAAPAWAQGAPSPQPQTSVQGETGGLNDPTVEEVIVTGTRVEGRTRLDSVAPVDVISNAALVKNGTGVELASSLANNTPALNFPRPAINDGTDSIRPATLRGLAPDQTLVLLNGIRGHVSALLQVNGGIGRGSTAFDLNTIPTVAVQSVEVLRDGAAAQYGADAIAGVINVRLREANSGGGVTLNYGVYDTEFNTARGRRKAKDGVSQSAAGWVGLPLFGDGFLTLSGEYVDRNPTNRSDFAAAAALPPGNPGPLVLGRYGDPELESYAGYANFGGQITEGVSFFGYAGYQHRDSESAATARAFNNANNIAAFYPGGFLPLIAPDIDDWNGAFGVRGDLDGWETTAKVGYGGNTVDYRVNNTVNASLGTTSPRSFDAGGLKYEQAIVNIDTSKGLEVGMAAPLNVAFGVELRRERFKVTAGEPASYTKYPTGTGGSTAGSAGNSQGFPGFRPTNEVDVDRHNWSAYVDVEGKPTEDLTIGVAVRGEDYSDFGSELTGKIAARYDFGPNFAIRGAASRGVKAPALQQQFFSYTSTNLVTTVVGGVPQSNLIEAGTFRVNDPIAITLGAQPLKAEDAENFSLGFIFRTGGFELTVDAYQIDVDDRVVYSENLGVATPSTPAGATAVIQARLAPFGVSAARFFLNGVDTRTKGVDVVARYRLDTDFGRFDLTGAANLNTTDVRKVPPITALQPQPLFDRGNILQFEEGTPERKIVATVEWGYEAFGATLRATRYDSVLQSNNNIALDYATGVDTVVDLEGRFRFRDSIGVAVGASNLTDVQPNFTPAAINAPTGSIGFPGYAPFGFNGRQLYVRLSYDF